MTRARTAAGIGSAAAIAAALLAGCGGAAQQPVDAQNQSGVVLQRQQQTATAPVAAPRATPTPARAPAPAATPKPQSFAVEPLAKVEERALRRLQAYKAQQDRSARMSAAAHARAVIGGVRDLTEAVLVSAGLEFATYDVLDGGKTVVVDVARHDACSLRPSDPTQIADRIVNASDVVEHVHLRLTPSGELGAYRKAHCGKVKAPVGLGPTLLTAAQGGVQQTKAFHVSRASWTIQWTSSSDILQVYVYEGGKLRSVAVNAHGRGSGVKTLHGRGTYTLRIAGTGGWSVTVRDGSPTRQPTLATPEAPPSDQP